MHNIRPRRLLSALLTLCMVLTLLPMTALPVYAADATQIKIWDGTEMKTYTLGTDTLPTGLSWNSTYNRLELDGYNGGRIEQATSGDELTFYVVNDSIIEGGEEIALKYSNPTIDGATGKTLTLTGTKSSVMNIGGSCTIKNITVKVDQKGTVKPNGYTTATSGNIFVREGGRLEVELNKETDNPYAAQGVSNLWLYDNGSASITVTANNTSTTDAYGVSDLYLYGTGDCDITVTNNGSGNTWAVQYEPNIYSSYNVTGAWNSPSVSYTAVDPNTNADLSALTCDLGAVSPTFKSNVTSYTGPNYPYNKNKAGITATVAETGASLKINGEAATSGVLKYVPIAVGANDIPVVVTSKDSSTTKTYTLTITRQSGGSYNLTVVNGSKDPDTDTVEAGDTVTITANTPDTGKVFDKWTSEDGVTFANASSSTTTFTMPTEAVTVTATYKDTYSITVNSGSADKTTAAAGETVTITANTPDTGKVFDKWTSEDGVTFADASSATTTFTMPTEAVTVTATYKTDPDMDTELSDIKVRASKGGDWENPALTPAFDRETRSYSLNLTSEYKSIYFYLPVQVEGQTITATVDGNALEVNTAVNGFQTAQHTLTKATTVFVFTITAKDGSTTGTYTVTVNRGSGTTHAVTVTGGTTTTPTATAGDTVTITANEPAPGKVFDKWTTTDGVAFANANSATTTFVMPAKAVTVTATYKDAPVTTYAVTVNSGTGGGDFAEGATVSITANAPATGKVFDKWTTSDGVVFANANSATTTFVMPAKAVTVTATYKDAPVSGGGGGTSAPQQTIPAADGAVQVNYTTSGGTASLSLPESKINDIIAKSKGDEALIDLSKVSGATAVELPKAALTAFGEAGLGLSIQLPAGSITLNQEAAADIAGQATASNLKLELKQAASSSLTAAQREAIKSGDMVLDINIYSGTDKITQFDGKLTINVPYTGPQPVAVWYLNDKGELEKLIAVFANGIVSFELNHLSLYVLGQDTDWVNPFADIQEADWFYKAVEYVYENGLMVGTGDTAFDPNGTTTRAMIVTILHRLEQTPAPTANNPFSDVADGKWYTNAVVWAAESGIVSGYGNDTFGPEDNITREQMAAILYRYAQLKSYDVSGGADLSKFNDAENISGWALRSLGWANEKGLITGTSDVTLDPQGQATRAQVAAILQRFIENIGK